VGTCDPSLSLHVQDIVKTTRVAIFRHLPEASTCADRPPAFSPFPSVVVTDEPRNPPPFDGRPHGASPRLLSFFLPSPAGSGRSMPPPLLLRKRFLLPYKRSPPFLRSCGDAALFPCVSGIPALGPAKLSSSPRNVSCSLSFYLSGAQSRRSLSFLSSFVFSSHLDGPFLPPSRRRNPCFLLLLCALAVFLQRPSDSRRTPPSQIIDDHPIFFS